MKLIFLPFTIFLLFSLENCFKHKHRNCHRKFHVAKKRHSLAMKAQAQQIKDWELEIKDERSGDEYVREKVKIELRSHSLSFGIEPDTDQFKLETINRYLITPAQSADLLKSYSHLLSQNQVAGQNSYAQKKLDTELKNLRIKGSEGLKVYLVPLRLIPNCDIKLESFSDEEIKNEEHEGKNNFITFKMKIDENMNVASNYETSHKLLKIRVKIHKEDSADEIDEKIVQNMKFRCEENKKSMQEAIRKYLDLFKHLKESRKKEKDLLSLSKELISQVDTLKMKIQTIGKIFVPFSNPPNRFRFIVEDLTHKQRTKTLDEAPMVRDLIPELELA